MNLGPATRVSLGTLAGFVVGAVVVFGGLYEWRRYEIEAITADAALATTAHRDLEQARADIVKILQWQASHTDFSSDAVRALNNNFEVLRLGLIQTLEYQQRDAETKHIRPPTVPGRLYEPMLLPTPGNLGHPIHDSLRDLIRELKLRQSIPDHASAGGSEGGQ